MYKQILFYGFAIFSMFFGSGNLVFPIIVGLENIEYWQLAFIGFFITGILLPLVGLFVIKYHNGSYKSFFNEAGKISAYFLPLFILSLLGSFGVIPRCVTVAYGGMSYYLPDIGLASFSFIFCATCYVISFNDNLMFTLLGKILTPLLILLLLYLIVTGMLSESTSEIYSQSNSLAYEGKFIVNGFKIGYSTMDLFAAFFFSSLIFNRIKASYNNDNMKLAIWSSIIGALMLSIIYLGLVYLGAKYSNIIKNNSGEKLLPIIANHLLGKQGGVIISIIILLSCLTTAVALNNIYAKYLQNIKYIGECKLSILSFITITISYIISLNNFEKISNFLGFILNVTYPSIIFLTIISLATKRHKWFKIAIFYILLAFNLLKNII